MIRHLELRLGRVGKLNADMDARQQDEGGEALDQLVAVVARGREFFA
jgi:hypothetical protein